HPWTGTLLIGTADAWAASGPTASATGGSAPGVPPVLGGQPHRRVRGAVAVIAGSPFDHLEEHRTDRGRVEVQELSGLVPVVEDVVLAQGAQQLGIEGESGLEVLVVVLGDLEELEAAAQCRGRGGE